jgi:hypothetical protein
LKQTLILTPETAYQSFQEGHLGFVLPQGVLILNIPHDLESCVLLAPRHQTVWQGHANSQEALKLMQQTQGFALIKRINIENPYEDIDFSAFEGAFNIPVVSDAMNFTDMPEDDWLHAQAEIHAFLAGQIGYLVDNGILKLQTPNDPDSCVLEVFGHVLWYGNAFSDEAHAMIEKSTETVLLQTAPATLLPLQA